jgi:hypothetical protein
MSAEPLTLSREDLTFSCEKLPLPATREGIVALVRHVLSKSFVQEIKISVLQGVEISWFRDVSDSLSIADPDDVPASVMQRVELDDFSVAGSGKEVLLEAMLDMSSTGEYFPEYLFVGSFESLKDWLGVPRMTAFPAVPGTSFRRVVGLRALETPSLLEEDVIVLLAGRTTGARLADVSRAYRIG